MSPTEPVGERLAQAAMGVVYHGKEAYAGPTISGCSVAADTITITYNSSLLRGGAVGVKPYDGKSAFSAFRVLVDPHYWCSKTTFTVPMLGHQKEWFCDDPEAPNWGTCGTDVQCGAGPAAASVSGFAASPAVVAAAGNAEAAPAEVWMLVDVKSKSGTEVTLDLSKLPKGSKPIAVRYAWDNDKDSCCAALSSTTWCEPAACPIWDTKSGLPGNPFMAKIEGGKCACVAPQKCDGAS